MLNPEGICKAGFKPSNPEIHPTYDCGFDGNDLYNKNALSESIYNAWENDDRVHVPMWPCPWLC